MKMEPKILTRDQKIEYFGAALAVAGIRFDQVGVIDLLVDIYDKMIDTGGKIGLDEIIDIKNDFVKRSQQNERVRTLNPENETPKGAKNRKGATPSAKK
jgi:hypothetical protein